jgi:DNA invertase Pin-like site-specific DNA recombinase
VTKAFGYLRVSGKGQVEGDGFTRQRAAIKAYAEGQGIKIIRWFEEKGISGTTELDSRPALLAMLEALAANGTKLVLIEKLDRLARDLMVQETIIGDLRKRGFELVSVSEPDLLQNDPTRVLMRQVFGAIAQYEKAMIVAKLRGARQRVKAKDGRCEGRKPYGTRQGEMEVLAKMRALRSEGLAYDRIAASLNAEGVKPRSGTRWHGVVVNRILNTRMDGRERS